MKKLLLLFGLSLLIFPSNAQNLEPIVIVKRNHYYQQDVRLSTKTIKVIVKPSLSATQEVKRGRSIRVWGDVLAGLGGGLIGSAIAGGENISSSPSYNISPGAAIGIGIAAIAGGCIVFGIGSKQIENGVKAYNSYIKSAPKTSSLNLGLSNHGVGLTVRF